MPGPIILVGAANLAARVLALVAWLRSGRPVRFDPAEARSSSTMETALH
jgi:hypothetical protein